MTTAAALLTAEEYRLLPDNGRPTELVRGELVLMNMPFPRHGEICVQVAYLLRQYLDRKPLGRVVSNDAGMITGRNPDTVRGMDVAFYSYARLPAGPLPQGYLEVPPELIFEVRSPNDCWSANHAKVADYLNAGVTTVCVLDEQTQTLHIFHADQAPRLLTAEEELVLPEPLGEFRIRVRRFFE
jgi:Uma2 family endonuclease